jgi:hypothetical protein
VSNYDASAGQRDEDVRQRRVRRVDKLSCAELLAERQVVQDEPSLSPTGCRSCPNTRSSRDERSEICWGMGLARRRAMSTSPSHWSVAKSVDIVPSGFFVFRTPLLPFDALASWGEGLAAPSVSADPGAHSLSEALERDRAVLEERLRALISQKEIREALFLASPSLDEAVQSWLGDPTSHRARNVVGILVRSLARMSGRCSPFELFSGSSLGRIGKGTHLDVAPREQYRRHTRLDASYLHDLCVALGKNRELRARLRFRPNSGIYEAAGQLRYPEARADIRTVVGGRSAAVIVAARAVPTAVRAARWKTCSAPSK